VRYSVAEVQARFMLSRASNPDVAPGRHLVLLYNGAPEQTRHTIVKSVSQCKYHFSCTQTRVRQPVRNNPPCTGSARQDRPISAPAYHPCIPCDHRSEPNTHQHQATGCKHLRLCTRDFTTTTLDQSAESTPPPYQCFASIHSQHSTLLCALDQAIVAMAATFQPNGPEDVANKVLRRAQVSKVCTLCCDN
jgi:hypothetical protein